MSDFDKEKEREKLRKKFEAEEARRETTEQMSELLLKGATMLNKHCAECAAPIFRHDGREFCPTCQRPADEIPIAGPGDLSGPSVPPAEPEAETQPAPAPSAEEDQTVAEPAEPEPSPDPEPAETEPPSQPVISGSEEAYQDQAIESLTAAITRLSDRAATAEDPRQAQELLSAAKEAADVIHRLRQH